MLKYINVVFIKITEISFCYKYCFTICIYLIVHTKSLSNLNIDTINWMIHIILWISLVQNVCCLKFVHGGCFMVVVSWWLLRGGCFMVVASWWLILRSLTLESLFPRDATCIYPVWFNLFIWMTCFIPLYRYVTGSDYDCLLEPLHGRSRL